MSTDRERLEAGIDPEELERMPWAYRSPCYRALNLSFGVRCADPDVGAFLDRVLAGLRSSEDDPEVWYSIARSTVTDRPFALFFGSELVVLAHSKSFAIDTLLWHLNRATVDRADPFVVLHAGGVALDGAGVIISAPSGGGKTTLTAALVRAGFRYLTDEAVAIDPVTGLLHAYPKSLTIQPGSWELLADLRPPPSDLSPRVWHVSPTDIRPDAIADPTPPAMVLLPTRLGPGEPDGVAGMEEIPRPDAMVHLFRHSFGSTETPVPTLKVLGDILAGCACFRISTADLGLAVNLVSKEARRIVATPGR